MHGLLWTKRAIMQNITVNDYFIRLVEFGSERNMRLCLSSDALMMMTTY